MQDFRNILFDATQLEKEGNKSIQSIINFLKISKAFFFYFEPESDTFADQNPDMESESVIDKYRDRIRENLDGEIEAEIIKLRNDPIKAVLGALMEHGIDLIVLDYGNSSIQKEGIVKIAKNSYCSVLVLPHHCMLEKIKKVLVPIDFSEFSRQALTLSLQMAQNENVSIILNHVFFVPPGYHATGKSYGESANIEKQAAKKEFSKFLKIYDQHQSQFSCSYILDDDKDPTDKIYNDAVDNEAGLIIMGAKGKTNAAGVLIGSIAFGLLLYNQDVPLLIIKNKKANYDLAENVLRNM